MKQCLNCSNPAKVKFCSRSCSVSYNNKIRVRSEESKKRTSMSIKRAIKEGRAKPAPGFDQTGRSWARLPDNTWEDYKKSCRFYTPYHVLDQIEGHELVEQYGWYHPKRNPQGASRDHRYSIKEGWNNNVPVEVMRHLANCRIMLIHDNKVKSTKCSLTLEELYKQISEWRPR